jgi:hypothetical protein
VVVHELAAHAGFGREGDHGDAAEPAAIEEAACRVEQLAPAIVVSQVLPFARSPRLVGDGGRGAATTAVTMVRGYDRSTNMYRVYILDIESGGI